MKNIQEALEVFNGDDQAKSMGTLKVNCWKNLKCMTDPGDFNLSCSHNI